tara:strand:- start:808 stop:1074 length:267 start_codon:yes stop_codon:yes gene_type:complete
MKLNYFFILFTQISLILLLSFEQIKLRWEISILYNNQDNINFEFQKLKEEEYKLKTEVYFLNSPVRIEKYAKEELNMEKVKPRVINIK